MSRLWELGKYIIWSCNIFNVSFIYFFFIENKVIQNNRNGELTLKRDEKGLKGFTRFP